MFAWQKNQLQATELTSKNAVFIRGFLVLNTKKQIVNFSIWFSSSLNAVMLLAGFNIKHFLFSVGRLCEESNERWDTTVDGQPSDWKS